MVWSCSVEAPACAGDDSDDRDDSRVHVENAHFSIMPDAGLIDLFDTLDAVDQKMANVGEMLTINRPDLMPESGMEWSGDLLVLHSVRIDPKFRGHKLGHAVLKAIRLRNGPLLHTRKSGRTTSGVCGPHYVPTAARPRGVPSRGRFPGPPRLGRPCEKHLSGCCRGSGNAWGTVPAYG